MNIDLKLKPISFILAKHQTHRKQLNKQGQSNEFHPKNANCKCKHHQIRKVATALRPQGCEFQSGPGE